MAEVPGIAASETSPRDGPTPGELDRLRAENELLRTRLSAAETVAAEREQRVEDLLAALQGLPQAWMQYLERTGGGGSSPAAAESSRSDPATVIEVLASRPDEPLASAGPTPGPISPRATPPADLAAAAAAWKEARLLRDRLERERLDKELERLQSRKRWRRRLRGLRQSADV